MRFEFYHEGLREVPKLSVDGTVDNAIHFSHWKDNQTPVELRADTSTEITLNLVASPRRRELTRGITLVTNNHFDTDGVLSVWTTLAGERALELRAELIAAAEAGDFSELSSEQGVRVSLCLQGTDGASPDSGVASPLARHLAGGVEVDEARAYELVLPEVERLVRQTNDYEFLWREGWEAIARASESFVQGRSTVDDDEARRLSVVVLSADIYGAEGFDPARHVAPFAAITQHARGRLYLIATPMREGWSFRLDYPYYSWAETVVRPRIARYELAPLVRRLNELEGRPQGSWKLDRSELTSAVKFAGEGGKLAPSGLSPERVAEVVREELARESDAHESHAHESHAHETQVSAVQTI